MNLAISNLAMKITAFYYKYVVVYNDILVHIVRLNSAFKVIFDFLHIIHFRFPFGQTSTIVI